MAAFRLLMLLTLSEFWNSSNLSVSSPIVVSLSTMALRAASLIWLRSLESWSLDCFSSSTSSSRPWIYCVFSWSSLINLMISFYLSLSFSSSYWSDSSWFLYWRVDLYFSSYSSAFLVWKSSLVLALILWEIPRKGTSCFHVLELPSLPQFSSVLQSSDGFPP